MPDGQPEIFHTLQGEGASLGAPAVFLRLSRCNLSCRWCDTPYTWNFSDSANARPEVQQFDRASQTIELSVTELRSLLESYACYRLVITGGEPLLQQKEIVELLGGWSHFSAVEIETNGTIPPSPDLLPLVHQFNVSPKLAHSGDLEKKRVRPDALAVFQSLPNVWFKFVLSSPADFPEVDQFLLTHYLDRKKVVLMPEGTTPSALEKASLMLADLCIQRGYRFSPRLHVLLWGDERGK